MLRVRRSCVSILALSHDLRSASADSRPHRTRPSCCEKQRAESRARDIEKGEGDTRRPRDRRRHKNERRDRLVQLVRQSGLKRPALRKGMFKKKRGRGGRKPKAAAGMC